MKTSSFVLRNQAARQNARRLAPLVQSVAALAFLSLLVGESAAQTPPTLGNYPPTTVGAGSNATVTPDAAPTGTTSVSASTESDFNGVLAANPATGVVRITNAHPAGSYTITVRASNASGTTTRTFALTVSSGAACTPVQFTAAADVSGSGTPQIVAIGDFNNDGVQDIAFANNATGVNAVSIRLGNGAGGFGGTTNVAVGRRPTGLAIGDFNNDGNQDFASADTVDTISIRLGNGAGGFSAAPFIPGIASNPVAVAIGDFNNDGNQDFASANFSSQSVTIGLGNGAGGFGPVTNLLDFAGTNPRNVVIADFNNDGNRDLAVRLNGNGVYILLGNGAGGFGPANVVGLPIGGSTGLAIGDFNEDGNQDFASTGGTIGIRLGNGAGGFTDAANVAAGTNPVFVAVGDFNNDGHQDLAAVSSGTSGTVSIRLGDGAGAYSGTSNDPIGANPFSIALGDFNQDGKQDFAVANQTSNTIAIRLNSCTSTSVSLTSALSRKLHGAAGSFDIDLLAGTSPVESRTGGANSEYTIIFTFLNPLASVGGVAVTSGTGSVSTSGIGADAHQYVVNLTGVSNAQRITVTLTNVTDSLGNSSSAVAAGMGVLVGDTTGNGSVTASDIGQVKAQSGQTVTAANFRTDVNAGGTINASDIGLVKSSAGTQLP